MVFSYHRKKEYDPFLISPSQMFLRAGFYVSFLRLIAAPEKLEVKKFGALEHRNDGMAVSSGGYSASNFSGSALCMSAA